MNQKKQQEAPVKTAPDYYEERGIPAPNVKIPDKLAVPPPKKEEK